MDIKKYDEPDKSQWANQNGFIALSYFGVDRNGTPKRISKKELDKQLNALYGQGYETISQQDVIDFYTKGKPLPEKALFEEGKEQSRGVHELEMVKYALDQSAMIMVMNATGNIIDLNKNYRDMMKYSLTDLYMQDFRVLNTGYHSEMNR